jgi:hypothetical protein
LAALAAVTTTTVAPREKLGPTDEQEQKLPPATTNSLNELLELEFDNCSKITYYSILNPDK